jgi:hypothetical protein
MPLQNRVTPWGDIVADPARGLLMGNRGILHDADRRIVRYAVGRRFIACLTAFRGRRRAVMTPGTYTELFFLDEAVALAAGHRPCAECRREDYQRFQAAWAAAGLGATSADEMDLRLHADRLAAPRTRRTYREAIDALPDGAFVELDGAAWLVWGGSLLAWSHAGYGERRAFAARRAPDGQLSVLAQAGEGAVTVITPRCVVDAIRAGYRPGVHPSAE